LVEAPLLAALARHPSLQAPPAAEGAAHAPRLRAGGCRCWALPHDVAARGAAALAAARQQRPCSALPPTLDAADSAPRAVALAHTPAPNAKAGAAGAAGAGAAWRWPACDVDELFPRDVALPCRATRTLDAGWLKQRGLAGSLVGRAPLSLTLCEGLAADAVGPQAGAGGGGGGGGGLAFARALPLGDPLLRPHPKTSVPERGVSVALEFELDASGLLSVHAQAFVSEKDDDARRHAAKGFVGRNLGRILMAMVVALLLGGQAWSLYADRAAEAAKEGARMAARRAALTKFYKQVNPEKVRLGRLRARYRLWRCTFTLLPRPRSCAIWFSAFFIISRCFKSAKCKVSFHCVLYFLSLSLLFSPARHD
jgi:hypothetical protein